MMLALLKENKDEMILVGENGLEWAIGSIHRAFIGNAAGAVLEFYPEIIKRVDVDDVPLKIYPRISRIYFRFF